MTYVTVDLFFYKLLLDKEPVAHRRRRGQTHLHLHVEAINCVETDVALLMLQEVSSMYSMCLQEEHSSLFLEEKLKKQSIICHIIRVDRCFQLKGLWKCPLKQ